MYINSNCLEQGHVAATSALTINLSKIFLNIPYENDQPFKDIWISSFYIFLMKMIPYHNFFIIIMVYLLVNDTQAYLLL